MYSYAIIRTEKSMLDYCQKRWHETPVFNGDFAHIGGATIERIYEKTPTDDYYVPYYLMIAEDMNGNWSNVLTIRDKVHEDLRAGKANLVKGF